MTGTRRRCTREFTREAIRLYETSGKSVRQVESDLGITAGLLNKWRIHAALRQPGIICNHKRVERLMRLQGIRGCERRKRRPITTHSRHA